MVKKVIKIQVIRIKIRKQIHKVIHLQVMNVRGVVRVGVRVVSEQVMRVPVDDQ